MAGEVLLGRGLYAAVKALTYLDCRVCRKERRIVQGCDVNGMVEVDDLVLEYVIVMIELELEWRVPCSLGVLDCVSVA